jgi:outer membrane protein insertion porin family
LSLRAQTNGSYYQSYSLSFIEPWLGGRKPNSLSLSGYYTRQTNGKSTEDPEFQQLGILGGAVGLGKRLNWPDDYFFVNLTGSYQQYRLQNWNSLFAFSNGNSNVYALQLRFARRSIGRTVLDHQGSETSVSVKATPPWSVFNPGVNYTLQEPSEQYRLAEFHKWKFTSQWFTN